MPISNGFNAVTDGEGRYRPVGRYHLLGFEMMSREDGLPETLARVRGPGDPDEGGLYTRKMLVLRENSGGELSEEEQRYLEAIKASLGHRNTDSSIKIGEDGVLPRLSFAFPLMAEAVLGPYLTEESLRRQEDSGKDVVFVDLPSEAADMLKACPTQESRERMRDVAARVAPVLSEPSTP